MFIVYVGKSWRTIEKPLHVNDQNGYGYGYGYGYGRGSFYRRSYKD